MEYTIISGYQVVEVIEKVNERLKDGWALYGTLAVGAAPKQDGDLYAQAMTKAEPIEFSQGA
jgi:hypothetical protein